MRHRFISTLRPSLKGGLNAVLQDGYSLAHPSPLPDFYPIERLFHVHRLSLAGPECPTSDFGRRGMSLRHDAKGLLDIDLSGYIGIGDSNSARGTIHPHPEGCGLLYPLTPRDKISRDGFTESPGVS